MAMAICESHREQQWLQSQPDSAMKSFPSTYIHGCQDTGVTKHTVVSDDGFEKIPVASPSTSLPFSDVAPPSICDPALPSPRGPGRCFVVDEHVYWTENRGNAKLELQVAIHDCDIDDLLKTRHARFLRYPERTSSNQEIQEKNGSVTDEPNTGVYNNEDDDDDGEAPLCAKNTESCGDALLDPTAAENDPWEALGGAHNGPVVITYGMVSVSSTTPSMRFPHGAPHGARRGRSAMNSPRIPGGRNNQSVLRDASTLHLWQA